jgi:hypothetical protein
VTGARKKPSKVTYRYDIHICDSCTAPHLLFYNETGQFLCEATISQEAAIQIAAAIEERHPGGKSAAHGAGLVH